MSADDVNAVITMIGGGVVVYAVVAAARIWHDRPRVMWDPYTMSWRSVRKMQRLNGWHQ